jgi:predicted permease
MPDWRPLVRARLLSLRLDATREHEIVEELALHLDDAYREQRAAGRSHEDAMRLAVDEIDEAGLLAREMRALKQSSVSPAAQPGMPARHLLPDLWQDVRYAARTLAQSRGWTAVVVLLLALGIGANAAFFGATDALLISKLPVRDPDSLVRLRWAGPNAMTTEQTGYGYSRRTADGLDVRASFSYSMLQEFARDAAGRADFIASAPFGDMSVVIDGQAELATTAAVTGNYFGVLGVDVAAGRLFVPDDDRPGAPAVAVVSARYWRARLGGSPSSIGRVIKVNDVPVTIVGVVSPSFRGSSRPMQDPTDVIVPLSLDFQIKASSARGGPSMLTEPTSWWLQVMARLRPSVTAAQLQSILEGPFRATARANFDAYLKSVSDERRAMLLSRPRVAVPRLLVDSGSRGTYDVDGGSLAMAAALDAVVVVMLLIICANVANLMLSRAIARRKEIAVRLSLGATRFRLVRQLLTEALLLAILGAAGGLLVASWGKHLLPEPVSSASILNSHVLAFLLGATIVTTLVFGAVPALRATRVDINTGLKESGRGVAGSRTILARTLLVVQVALSLVLLVGAGLFLRTLDNLRRVDVGFDTRNLLLVRITPRLSGYDQVRTNNLYKALTERFGAIGGVRGVAMTNPVLLAGAVNSTTVWVQGRSYASAEPGADTDCNRMVVSPEFFRVYGIPVIVGRGLTDRDDEAAPRVAVVNETAARTLFQGNALGRRFGNSITHTGDIEVVGVVRDVKYSDLREPAPPTMYVSSLQAPRGAFAFALRATVPPASIVPTVRAVVRDIDPDLPITRISTQADEVEKRLAPEKLFAQSYAVFGGIALLLASIGLFGLMSYTVARRTAEMGIRLALGAQRPDVLQMIMRESLRLVAVGVACGLAIAIGAGRLVETMLFGLAPHDPGTVTIAIAVMTLVSAIAAYLPARRASRVNPIVALRYE